MCETWTHSDPILYESRTRTVRIHGVLTSIRIENLMWDTLARMAAAEGYTTNALIVAFHDELVRHRGEVRNFASFLRVTCLRYMERTCERLQAANEPSVQPPLPAAVPRAAASRATVVALRTP